MYSSKCALIGSHFLRLVLPHLAHQRIQKAFVSARLPSVTRAVHRQKQLLDVGVALDKRMRPKVVVGVFDKLDEGDKEAPGVGSVHDDAF